MTTKACDSMTTDHSCRERMYCPQDIQEVTTAVTISGLHFASHLTLIELASVSMLSVSSEEVWNSNSKLSRFHLRPLEEMCHYCFFSQFRYG